MSDKIMAKDILQRHFDKKKITDEHIHVAAYMSCIDAINEALEMNVQRVAIGGVETTKSALPIQSVSGSLLVIGCNYHTTWQSHKSMRFVLTEIKGTKARLQTRKSRKDFWTNVDDLIFIESGYNKQKARELSGTNYR